MHIIYAEKYVSPRERPLTLEEAEVRRVAYAIKVPTSEALDTAIRSRIKDKTSYVLRGDGAALKDAAFYRAVERVNNIHGTVINDNQAGIDRERWRFAA